MEVIDHTVMKQLILYPLLVTDIFSIIIYISTYSVVTTVV